MSETPDLSKIIGLIMQNPEIISQIQKLADGTRDSDTKVEAAEVAKEEAISTSAPSEGTTEASAPINDTRQKRNKLLYAMKPYLSEDRSKAIDSMLSIAQILDMMKSR